jgi:aspartyl-tRNA(Asn)/glutamyl-tRNA(Gln) amidotransferase subunit A
LAFPQEALTDDVDTEVAAVVEAAVRVFAAQGAHVSAARLPNISHLHDLADVIQQSEVAAGHLDLLTLHRARYTPHIRRRIEGGLFVAAAAYLSALSQRATHTAAFIADTLGNAHALILPVLGILVPRIDETDESALGGGASELVRRMTRWTRWLNYLGVPALSIPCGVDHRGMPIGLQLVGRPFSEITLLEIARRFQEHTDWHVRRPKPRGT